MNRGIFISVILLLLRHVAADTSLVVGEVGAAVNAGDLFLLGSSVEIVFFFARFEILFELFGKPGIELLQ